MLVTRFSLINLIYHICIFENMGVVSTKLHPFMMLHLRLPLICFEITTGCCLINFKFVYESHWLQIQV